jgi:hypothetical protein
VQLGSPGAPQSEASALVGGWQERSSRRGYFSDEAAEIPPAPLRFVRLAAWAAAGAAVAGIIVAVAVGRVLAGHPPALHIASSHARTRASASSALSLRLPAILPAVPRSRAAGHPKHLGRRTGPRGHRARSSHVEQVAYRHAAASGVPTSASSTTSQTQAQTSPAEQSSSATTASAQAQTAQAASPAPHPGPDGPLVCVQNC